MTVHPFFLRTSTAILAACATISTAHAQRSTPVSVTGTVDVRPAIEKIFVYCDNSLGIDREVSGICRRADTRQRVDTVPDGLVFAVTDITFASNNIAVEGAFRATVGRDDGSRFPTSPDVVFVSDIPFLDVTHDSPQIVLRGGEGLRISNGSNSAYPIEVRISGYMVAEDDFGR